MSVGPTASFATLCSCSQLVLKDDGELRGSWAGEDGASLTQLDAGSNLLQLGETAYYLLGPQAYSRSWALEVPEAEKAEFKAKLQVSACLRGHARESGRMEAMVGCCLRVAVFRL
jgi:hypothetical protein